MVLCDSRGLGLQEKLDNTQPFGFVVRFVPSAGLVMAATKFLSEMIKLKPEYVIVAAGICEITLKNKTTKQYTVKCTNIAESAKLYVEAMEETVNLIHDVLPETKVIFNPVTGVDLEDYNTKARNGLVGEDLRMYHESKTPHPIQDILNVSVININKKIAKYNHTNKVATPWSATLVHKHDKGEKYHHHYQYLSDGCHLLDECAEFWAAKFQKAIKKSIEINSNG